MSPSLGLTTLMAMVSDTIEKYHIWVQWAQLKEIFNVYHARASRMTNCKNE